MTLLRYGARSRAYGLFAATSLWALLAAFPASTAHAATSGTAVPFMVQGNSSPEADGDFVSIASPGLNTYYSFFIEVPAGLASLHVDVFDADIGAGGTAEGTAGRDRTRGTFSTTTTYTLLTPAGGTQQTRTCNAATASAFCVDNGWGNVATVTNPTQGHWELRVRTGGNGSDLNAFGVRGTDGDATAGGVELPVYYDSFATIGVNPPASGTSSVTYSWYPNVTSGCTASENDFDYDSDSGAVGSISLTSRAGLLSTTIASASLSATTAWKRNALSGFTSDTTDSDYGLWTANASITSYVNGSGQNGNYATLYFSNYAAAANPPTAQPQANAFRVYLPTDAGAAPVKPYIEQFVRHISGPQPPVVGSGTVDAITVKITNPTTHAITFSAANLVTANVPGAGTVYAGTPVTTAGTIVAQPAVGGTGNITWNPGTIAAGAAQYFSYRVTVTPTSAGQRIPVTATPASGNGTRAVYIDETGSATQTRAKYTYGPLCELALTAGLTSDAFVSRFDSYDEDGRAVLEWETSSETGTIGFDVYRVNRKTGATFKVNDEMLLGLVDSPEGGTYRLADESGTARGGEDYYLVETEASGAQRIHGPLASDGRAAHDAREAQIARNLADPSGGPTMHTARNAMLGDYERGRRTLHAASPLVRFPRHLPRVGNATAAYIAVRESGIYEVTSGELGSALGLSAASIELLVRTRGLALTNRGADVAWTATVKGDAIRFYGEAIDSPYTRDNEYRIARGAGLPMATDRVALAHGATSPSYMASVHAEENKIAGLAIAPDPESDYWYWDYVQSGNATFGSRSYAIDVPSPVAGADEATLTVSLQGATSTGAQGEHHVAVALNGVAVGESRWEGVTPLAASFMFDPGILVSGQNQVDLVGLLDAGVPYSVVFVNAFDVSYARAYDAGAKAIAFTADHGGALAIDGFGDAHVALYNVADSRRPRIVSGATIAPSAKGYRASFGNARRDAKYVALTNDQVLRSADVRTSTNAGLRTAHNAADYVVIASTDLRDAAQALVDYRQSKGLRSIRVDLQSIYDEFNGGIASPWAIQSFLAYAKASWSVAPRYAVLAGDGSYDYRDLLGADESNQIPPILVQQPGGLFASDATMADLTGNDGIPDIALGRIPADSPSELTEYIAKVIAHEKAADDDVSAVLLAGRVSGDVAFGAASDALADAAPLIAPRDRVYLDAIALADARARLFADLAASPTFVSYIGHGGTDRFDAAGLLTTNDAALLPPSTALPVFAAFSCAIGRFELPGIDSLGEMLIRAKGAGAIAVFSPTGLSEHGEATLLSDRFFREASSYDAHTIGSSIQRALQSYDSAGGAPGMIQIYTLLGDPAVTLPAPRSSALASGGAPGEIE